MTEPITSSGVTATLARRGWLRLVGLAGVADWVAAALPLARDAIAASPEPWRCGGTWFPGVDALPNARDGSVAGNPLPPALVALLPWQPPDWHRAQVSTVRPGYPQPWAGESSAAFGFRLNRGAAHVDGLLPEGPERRRHLREPHAFILGLPLTEADPGAAPLVVWEGSQTFIRAALAEVLAPHPPEAWGEVDLTDAYHEARRNVFGACPRVELPARPGEVLLLHRLVLHGTAPWSEGARAAPQGRVIAFFRPQVSSARWLDKDL